jgi:hypothetical protein
MGDGPDGVECEPLLWLDTSIVTRYSLESLLVTPSSYSIQAQTAQTAQTATLQ